MPRIPPKCHWHRLHSPAASRGPTTSRLTSSTAGSAIPTSTRRATSGRGIRSTPWCPGTRSRGSSRASALRSRGSRRGMPSASDVSSIRAAPAHTARPESSSTAWKRQPSPTTGWSATASRRRWAGTRTRSSRTSTTCCACRRICRSTRRRRFSARALRSTRRCGIGRPAPARASPSSGLAGWATWA